MDRDSLLIATIKNGSDKAMEIFVRKYYPDILSYCRRHLSDPFCAEDVTQETFERFFRNIQSYIHYGKAKNYLYVIAGNLCKNHYHLRRESPLGKEERPCPDFTPGVDRRLDVEAAMDRLSPELREALSLYYYQGLKLKEIAAVLDIGLPLVKYRLARGKELIRQMLEP